MKVIIYALTLGNNAVLQHESKTIAHLVKEKAIKISRRKIDTEGVVHCTRPVKLGIYALTASRRSTSAFIRASLYASFSTW